MHLKVEVGDIISEIDGKVTHAMTPEMVAKVVKSTGGKRPITMSVTKTHSKEWFSNFGYLEHFWLTVHYT